MARGFGYSKHDDADCFTCCMCSVECARGGICEYDLQPIQHGYRCGLYIVKTKPDDKDTVKQNELF